MDGGALVVRDGPKDAGPGAEPASGEVKACLPELDDDRVGVGKTQTRAVVQGDGQVQGCASRWCQDDEWVAVPVEALLGQLVPAQAAAQRPLQQRDEVLGVQRQL